MVEKLTANESTRDNPCYKIIYQSLPISDRKSTMDAVIAEVFEL